MKEIFYNIDALMLVLGLDSLMPFATDHICVVIVVAVVVVVGAVVVVDVVVFMITLSVHDHCSLAAFTAKFSFGRENVFTIFLRSIST
jgi:hypothetical protein